METDETIDDEAAVNEAIEEALEGKPRSYEIASMVDALKVRRNLFHGELKLAPSEKAIKDWKRKLKDIDSQINTLEQEMAITDFVERSIIAMSKQTVFTPVEYPISKL